MSSFFCNIDRMKIITLSENLVYQKDLIAEHGLSIYMEVGDQKILFDTGQSDSFMLNAQSLGIAIEEIDTLVLSHGHFDHTGGLYPFLEKNQKARVYASENIFIPKYNKEHHFIGTVKNELVLKNRMVYVEKITEIAHNVFIMPRIQISNPTNTFYKGFSIKVNEQYLPDPFDDELFLAICQDEQLNIITACSHHGIINICTTATDHFNLPVNLILGGFHMKNSSGEQLRQVNDYFQELKPKSIGVCHCTGVDKYAEMRQFSETHLFYNFTGYRINIR